jgi:hypothetical protein
VSKQEITATDHELTSQEVATNCLRRIYSRGQVERRSASDPPNKAVRAMLDVQRTPPSWFALPNDGRQSKHLCEARKAVAVSLASRARADGSNITVSAATIAREIGRSRPTVVALMQDLEQLGLLKWKEGDWEYWREAKTSTKRRSLDLSVLPDVKSSIPDVKDSGFRMSNLQGPDVKSSIPDVKDSGPGCQILHGEGREDLTQSGLRANERANGKQTTTQTQRSASEASPFPPLSEFTQEAAQRLGEFKKRIPDAMRGALFLNDKGAEKGGKRLMLELFEKHTVDVIVEAMESWAENRQYPINEFEGDRYRQFAEEAEADIEEAQQGEEARLKWEASKRSV